MAATASTGAGGPGTLVNRKLLILIIAIVAVAGAVAFVFGVFGSSGGSGVMPAYLTVGQALALPARRTAEVGGDVEPGSVGWNSAASQLVFTLTGEGREIHVAYPGVAPKDFKHGAKILVKGSASDSGYFLATSLQTTASLLCRACHG